MDQRGEGLAVPMPHGTGKNIRQVLVRNADRARRLSRSKKEYAGDEVSERASLELSLNDGG